MDLNNLTNEELQAIAGPPSTVAAPMPSALNPNSLTDAQLMEIAGPPSQSKPTPAPLSPLETLSGGLNDILDKFTFGAGDEIVGAGSAVVDDMKRGFGKFTGLYDAPAGNYQARKDQAQALRLAYNQEHPYSSMLNNVPALFAWAPKLAGLGKGATAAAEVVANPTTGGRLLNAAKVLGASAAETGALSGIQGFNSTEGNVEDRLTGAAQQAALGAAIGAPLTGVFRGIGAGASKLGEVAPEWSRLTMLKAYGAGKNAINKAVKRMPEVLDDSGDFVNPISSAIESFRAQGGGLGDMSGATLTKELNDQVGKISGALTKELKIAQEKQTDAITPAFEKTKAYIEGLAGVDKAKAAKIAEEEIAATLNATDGTILSLQQEKERLGTSIAESAWGEDVAGRLRNNILKRIRSDLRTAVEDNYSKLTGKPAEVIKGLNDELGKRLSLKPIFNDMLTSGESRDVVSSILQAVRTSGGAGQAMVGALAGFGAGGVPAAVMAPATLMYANTPQGKRAIAEKLASGIFDKTAGVANALADRTPNALALLTKPNSPDDSNIEEAPADYGKGQSQQLANALLAGAPADNSRPTGISEEILAAELAKQLFSNGLSPLSQGYSAPILNEQRPMESKRPNNNIQTSAPSVTEAATAAPKPTAPQSTKADSSPSSPIDKRLVEAVIMKESGGKADAIGPETDYGRAKGKMQLLDSTGKEMHKKLGIKEPYDPFNAEQNTKIGTAYLKELADRYYGSVPLALASYNWGMGNVDKAIAKIGKSGPMVLQAHLEKETRDGMARGLSEAQAKRAAAASMIERFGSNVLDDYLPDETRNYVRKILNRYNKTSNKVVRA